MPKIHKELERKLPSGRKSRPIHLDFKQNFLRAHNISQKQINDIAKREMPLIKELLINRKRIAELYENIRLAEAKKLNDRKKSQEYDDEIKDYEKDIENSRNAIFELLKKSNNSGLLELIYKIMYDDPNRKFLSHMVRTYREYPKLSKEDLFLASLIKYALDVFAEQKQKPNQHKLFMALLKQLSEY